MGAAVRWAVDISGWDPESEELEFFYDLLPTNESEDCKKFLHKIDKQRALVSRLLQRKCAAQVLHVPFSDVTILRTRGKRPYVTNNVDKSHCPNFNYNVSHEGRYVVLASEGVCVVGADVSAPQNRRTGSLKSTEEFLKCFKDQLTPTEWSAVYSAAPSDCDLESRFRRFWSMKEAFVKARGDGIAFELKRVEFHVDMGLRRTQATVLVDGQPQHRWRVASEVMCGDHWVSVARAPPEAVIDAWGGFKATFQKPSISDDEMQVYLDAPAPDFQMLTIEDLVPKEFQSAYHMVAIHR